MTLGHAPISSRGARALAQHRAWLTMLPVLAAACGGVDPTSSTTVGTSPSEPPDAATEHLTETASAAHHLWIVRGADTVQRDLPGLFQCLFTKTDFNERAMAYPGGYALAWGGMIDVGCKSGEFDCAVDALRAAGRNVADHDMVMIIVRGRCGGDNNAHHDGSDVGNIRVRGANVGDCAKNPRDQERVAVHEAFESVSDASSADCCNGQVTKHCPGDEESLCSDCPCTCGRYNDDNTLGGYNLDCGNGAVYRAQRIPTSPAGQYNPDACEPFAMQ
jgi:hypothetical protein